MALDRINLYPKRKSAMLKLNSEQISILILGVAVLFGLMLTLHQYIEFRRKTEESRIAEVAKKELQQKISMIETQGTSNESRKVASAQSFLSSKIHWSAAMKELTLLTSANLWLKSMTGESKDNVLKILMTGEALSQSLISNFSSALEGSFYFRNVKLNFSERLDGMSPAVYRFQFECNIAKFKFGEVAIEK